MHLSQEYCYDAFQNKITFKVEEKFHPNSFINDGLGGMNKITFKVEANFHPNSFINECLGGMIGWYFFEDNEGFFVPVNDAHYSGIFQDFLGEKWGHE